MERRLARAVTVAVLLAGVGSARDHDPPPQGGQVTLGPEEQHLYDLYRHALEGGALVGIDPLLEEARETFFQEPPGTAV